MKDVRINKDVPMEPVQIVSKPKNPVDFRDKKIPSIIITFVQVRR